MGISQERIDKTNNLYKYTIGFNDILFYIGVFTSTLYTNYTIHSYEFYVLYKNTYVYL